MDLSTYSKFMRPEWSALRAHTPLTLTEAELVALRGVNESVSLNEVAEIYLPLSRLLNLHFRAARQLSAVKDEFLGRPSSQPPYIIAVAGSVAVGKSTFARVLQALLGRWPDHPHVALVATDGFLRPTAWLLEHGLMQRKGFPESYDRRAMIEFLARTKRGDTDAEVPVYSHQIYDIVPGEFQKIGQPDILIFEGLNVLQAGDEETRERSALASDFFDFSLYVDANANDIQNWYVERFLLLQRTAFQSPKSYFHHYRDLDEATARETARNIWQTINGVNLRENIRPTRERAHVILRKQRDHAIGEIWLRQI